MAVLMGVEGTAFSEESCSGPTTGKRSGIIIAPPGDVFDWTPGGIGMV